MEEHRLQRALNYSSKKYPQKERRIVYVVLCADFIKIGIATRPKNRLCMLQTGCPYELKMIAQYQSEDAARDEQRLHRLLSKFRHRGEWFKIPNSLIAMMVKAQSIAELFNDKL